MAKALLILLVAIIVCATATAQKVVPATNFRNAIDTTAVAKPFVVLAASGESVAKPRIVAAELERELLIETAQLRLQGRQDAKQYYKSKGVFWGTMGTTLIYPAAGLATGTIVAIIPPSTGSAANPNVHLMKEPAYEEAFKKQAHRKRLGNAAAGFSIGVAVLGIISRVIVGGL